MVVRHKSNWKSNSVISSKAELSASNGEVKFLSIISLWCQEKVV